MKLLGARSVAARMRRVLDALFYVSVAAGAVVVASLMIGPVGGLVNLSWEPTAHFEFSPPTQLLAAGADAAGATMEEASGTLKVSSGGWGSSVIGFLFCVAMLGLAAFVLQNLRMLFASLEKESPFAPSNAGRIRRVGVAVIVAEMIRATFFYVESARVARAYSGAGIEFHSALDLQVGAILAGIILLVIAEAFRLGAGMKEEQDLTV